MLNISEYLFKPGVLKLFKEMAALTYFFEERAAGK